MNVGAITERKIGLITLSNSVKEILEIEMVDLGK